MAYKLIGKINPVPKPWGEPIEHGDGDTVVMSLMAGLPTIAKTEKSTMIASFSHGDHFHWLYLGSPQRKMGQIVQSEEELQYASGHRDRVFDYSRARQWGVYVAWENGREAVYHVF